MEKISRKEALAQGLTQYYTGKPCKYGHVDFRYVCDHRCAECARIKADKYKKNNPHKVMEHRARWKERYHSEPHIREKAIADTARWVRENKEKARAYQKAYHQKYREKRNAQTRAALMEKRKDPAWVERERARTAAKKKENPDAYKAYAHRRRARLRGAEGGYSASDISRILKGQGYKCVYCKSCIKDKYEVDHIVPISRGGSNWPSNIQCLCPTCNGRKWAKCPIQFAQENGMLL